ncbi:MAG TPA: sigma-70 family RNA polymerase sigma factor [Verrucomicrobiota bacterium]|nr:sigma-70 family RNA polymerase sigma factor [Verrucomicrobiota bacterium]
MTETRTSPDANVATANAGEIVVLTRRLAAQDEAAFREFHARYFDRLYRFLLVVTRGHEPSALEAVQETMLRVARHVRSFDDEEKFWCWLKAVARNAARDGGRRESRYRSLLARFFTRQQAATDSNNSEETRLQTLLAETLDELSPDERQLVEGKYLDGDGVKALSVGSGLTEKAVESRLLRLRRRLRERLLQKMNEQ